jgi:hypothetical protein
VARLVRDLGLAEDLAQDALVAALEHWPRDGVPANPGAWLMTTAKHRALDRLRRDQNLAAKLEQIGADLEAREALIVPDFVDALDAARQDDIGDDLLRLATRATPRPRATTGCAPRCATRRCAWRAYWPSWHRPSPRCMAWLRCWRSTPRAPRPAPTRKAARCCWPTRAGRAGTTC